MKASTPISATGSWRAELGHRHPRRAGFTLLELLVVLVIIGVMLTLGALAPGLTGRDEQLEQAAERLATLVRLGREQAVVEGRVLGLRFTETGYRFVALTQDGDWAPVTDDRLLRARTLADDTVLDIVADGEPVTPGRPGQDQPHVLLLPSGEVTAFEINMGLRERAGQSFRITGDVTGEVQLSEPATHASR